MTTLEVSKPSSMICKVFIYFLYKTKTEITIYKILINITLLVLSKHNSLIDSFWIDAI